MNNDSISPFKKIIEEKWEEVVNDLLVFPDRFSSEKSLVFNFAWKIAKHFDLEKKNIIIDFEKSLFEHFSDGTFLDLYIEVDKIKIGFEFKFPKSTKNGGSNKKQIRIKAINDIKRICYLANNDKIDIGVFLMVTNEISYTQRGKYKKAMNFLIYDDKCYMKNDEFPTIEDHSIEIVNPLKDITIRWQSKNNIYSMNPIFYYKI
jgi:hypothetical protein